MNFQKFKELAKRYCTVGYAVSIIFIYLGLDLANILLNPNKRIQRDCMFLRSPHEVVATGPFEITTEWKRFDIPKHIGRLPGIEDFVIEVRTDLADYTDDIPALIPRDLSMQSMLKQRKDGELIHFSVQVFNDKGKSVRLSHNTYSMKTKKQPQSHQIYYSLSNHAWRKPFYAKEEKLTHIEVKANSTITIEGIDWGMSGSCHWPNRRWEDIPEDRTYRFDGPSPATDELENRWERPKPKLGN